jgi:hypothetical protein
VPTVPLTPFAQTDTYEKQKEAGQLPDKTAFQAINGMNGHPERVRDYE